MGRLLPIREAAQALGVSIDTVRRWERSGRIQVRRDDANRRVVDEDEIRRVGGRAQSTTGTTLSARNRFEGTVTDVEISGVMALVQIQAGPHRLVSVITRDAALELGLAPGVRVSATVKATSVMVERR